jgi:hypothetical protein
MIVKRSQLEVMSILKKLSKTKLEILNKVANGQPVENSKAFRELCQAGIVNPLCGESYLPGYPVLTHLGANILIGQVLAEEFKDTPYERAARRISKLGMTEQTFDAELLKWFPSDQLCNTRNMVRNIDLGLWNPYKK